MQQQRSLEAIRQAWDEAERGMPIHRRDLLVPGGDPLARGAVSQLVTSLRVKRQYAMPQNRVA